MSSRAAEILELTKSLDEAELRSIVGELNRRLEDERIESRQDHAQRVEAFLVRLKKGVHIKPWTREELYDRDSR